MRKPLDPNVIKKINSQVSKRFPEVSGCEPKIRQQSTPQARASRSDGNGNADQFLLIYQGTVRTQSGKNLPRLVRVVVNAQGKIIKISTSH